MIKGSTKYYLSLLLLIIVCLSTAPSLYAQVINDSAKILTGTAQTAFSAFEIPKEMMKQSSRTMFPFGLLTGAITGSVRTVAGTLRGAANIVSGAAPYAKYMIFFV